MASISQELVKIKGQNNHKENVTKAVKNVTTMKQDGMIKRRHLSVVDNNDQLMNSRQDSVDCEAKCGRKVSLKSEINDQDEQKCHISPKEKDIHDSEKVIKELTGLDVVSSTFRDLPKGIINIDLNDEMYEYGADIVAHLRERETVFILPEDFLEQNSVTESMRSILVDWLVQVQHHLKFSQESLYLTIAMLDNILDKRDIEPDKLQLVGTTSFWIASKVEEYYPVDLSKLVHLMENSSKAHHIVQMEKIMLRILEFNVYFPEPMVFLFRFARAASRPNDSTFMETAQYLIDSFIIHVEFSATAPSQLAAGAVLASLHLFSAPEVEDTDSPPDLWSDTLVHYSGYSFEEVAPTALAMLKEVLRAATVEDYKYMGAYTKYKSNSQHGKLVLQAHLAPDVIRKAAENVNEIVCT